MGGFGDFMRRMRRSRLKKMLAEAGFPADSELIDQLEGIRSEPVYEEMPLRYDLFDGQKKLCRSESLYDLSASLKDPSGDIFIIGAGPSVKDQDISKLANRDTVLLNGAASLVASHGLDPLCTVIVDELFPRKRNDLIESLPAGSNLVVKFSVVKEIALRTPHVIENNRIFILHERPKEWGYPITASEEMLSLYDKPTHGVMRAGTVMSAALQTVAFLKPKRIFLLGFDIGNANEPRFYESAPDKVRTGLLNDYEDRILPFMKLTAAWCERNGIGIYNCSPVTKLPYDVVPYFDFSLI